MDFEDLVASAKGVDEFLDENEVRSHSSRDYFVMDRYLSPLLDDRSEGVPYPSIENPENHASLSSLTPLKSKTPSDIHPNASRPASDLKRDASGDSYVPPSPHSSHAQVPTN